MRCRPAEYAARGADRRVDAPARPVHARAQREHGDAFTIKIGTEPPWVMLAHPDAVREVFTGDPKLLHAGKANVVLRPFLGRASVLLLDGPQHLRQRKLMLPAFHGSRMAGYRDMVAEIAREQVAAWPRGEPSRSRRGCRRSRSRSSCA